MERLRLPNYCGCNRLCGYLSCWWLTIILTTILKIIPFSASSESMDYLLSDGEFRTNCIEPIETDFSIGAPSMEEMQALFWLSFITLFLDCCWGCIYGCYTDWDDEAEREDFCQFMLLCTGLEICTIPALMFHISAYVIDLNNQLQANSLYSCIESKHFKTALTWSITGMCGSVAWFLFLCAVIAQVILHGEYFYEKFDAWIDEDEDDDEADEDTELKYFEVDTINTSSVAVCSDGQCPCNEAGNPMHFGQGYIYISPEIVQFRQDCLTLQEMQQKLEGIRENSNVLIMFVGIGMPIFLCKRGAELRNLNLEVASQDARLWWNRQKLPLRATPIKMTVDIQQSESIWQHKTETVDPQLREKDSLNVKNELSVPIQQSDSCNDNSLNELNEEFESTGELIFTRISLYKTNSNVDDEKKLEVAASCDHNKCESFIRMSTMLRQHSNQQQWTNDTFDDKYNIRSAIDDFNHLLFRHQQQFDNLYDTLTPCECSGCTIYSRHVNGLQSPDDSSDDSVKEIVQQQIIDKIHCYCFHSFDTGYRIRTNGERRVSIQCNSDINDQENDSFNPRENRYLTEKDGIMYDEGIRYFYWPYYAKRQTIEDVTFTNNPNPHHGLFSSKYAANQGYSVKDWHIEKRYIDLKNELLNNGICLITRQQYDVLCQKTIEHFKSSHAKSITAKFGDEGYEIKAGEPIQQQHLMAMMTYCNFDTLQSKFSETYRRKENESDSCLKQRHRNFFHLGKLLREFTDCFGENGIGNRDIASTYLYHGVSTETQFSTVKIRMKGPVSATTAFGVATHFAGSVGLVLQFTLSLNWIYGNQYEPHDNQCAFVDCFWLSDYPYEQERFFIGGYAYFYIESIISIVNGSNYAFYIQAMRVISETMMDSNKWFLSTVSHSSDVSADVLNQIAFRLLSNELHHYYPQNEKYYEFPSCPEYMQQLFRNFCTHTENILLFNCPDYDYRIEFSYEKMKRMCIALFFYDFGIPKWDVIAKLFASAHQICIDANVGYKIAEVNGQNIKLISKEEFWNSLFNFLKGRTTPKIVLKLYPCGLQDRIEVVRSAVSSYRYDFNSIGWCISVDENYDELMIEHESLKANEDAEEEIKRKLLEQYLGNALMINDQ